MFQINKKVLKAKAQEEMESQFLSINERKSIINEALIQLKGKVVAEMA